MKITREAILLVAAFICANVSAEENTPSILGAWETADSQAVSMHAVPPMQAASMHADTFPAVPEQQTPNTPAAINNIFTNSNELAGIRIPRR